MLARQFVRIQVNSGTPKQITPIFIIIFVPSLWLSTRPTLFYQPASTTAIEEIDILPVVAARKSGHNGRYVYYALRINSSDSTAFCHEPRP